MSGGGGGGGGTHLIVIKIKLVTEVMEVFNITTGVRLQMEQQLIRGGIYTVSPERK